MQNDPIVEEMRKYGREFAAKHGNDIGRMCDALREKEHHLKRQVAHRKPKRIEQKAVS